MKLGASIVVAFLVCWLYLAAAVRDLDRNSALIGYREVTSERIVIKTSYGEIRIRAYHDKAPVAAKLVTDLAKNGVAPSLNFYRHEHATQGWGVDGFWGPPYGLLQGSLGDVEATPPFENGVDIEIDTRSLACRHPEDCEPHRCRKGHVCFIPNTKEFFIATVPHPEWNRAHAVWGEVDDLDVVDNTPFEPSFTRTDTSSPPIVTTWLNNSIPATISLQK